MRPQLLMFAYGVFIIGTLLSLICSGRWLLNGEINIINALSSFDMNVVSGWPIPTGIANFFSAIFNMISWNYPYLDNPWGFVLKLVLLFPVSIGVVIGLLELAATVVSGIFSAIRSLIPG
jgi:hypothetical protein